MKIAPNGGHPMSRRLGIVLLLQVLLFASSCDSRQPIGFALHELETEIRYCGEYMDFRKLPTPKALAVAGDPCGVFVSGLAYENDADPDDDMRPPDERAMERCDRRRADRRVAEPCVLHVIGDCPTVHSALQYCREHTSVPRDCAWKSAAPLEQCPSRRVALPQQ